MIQMGHYEFDDNKKAIESTSDTRDRESFIEPSYWSNIDTENIGNVSVTVGGLPHNFVGEIKTREEQLADEHWEWFRPYIETVLDLLDLNSTEREVLMTLFRMSYRDSMIHGWKHCLEEIAESDE